MKYAHTTIKDGVERVTTILPLSQVPFFDPANPPQSDTYGVADDVQIGWVKQSDGSFIVPPPEPPPTEVPQRVTRFQGMAVLYSAGLLGAIEAYMALPSTNALTKLAWTNAPTFERNSRFTLGMAAILGMSDAQIDAFFIQANQIN